MTAVGTPAVGTVAVDRTSQNRWLALTGILFAVLLGLALTLTSGLPDAKNPAKVQAWAIKHTGQIGASFILTALAVVIGLVFLTWLHSQLARERSWMGNVFAVGVVIFAMAGTVASGINGALSQNTKHLSTATVQTLASLSQNLNYSMTCVGLAMMYLGAGFLIRRTGLLPGWLAWVSWLFALLAATILLGFIPLLGTAVWIIVVAVYLAARPPAEA